jgi:hypothetical protein
MSVEEPNNQKPNLRSKGSKFGVKSGNTLKYDSVTEKNLKKPNLYHIRTIEEELDLERSKNDPKPFFSWLEHKPSVRYLSMDKNKGWEKVEELKQNPNYIIREESINIPPNTKDHDQLLNSFKKLEMGEEEEEEEVEIIKGRKGKTIKTKRTPGKKGVQKNEPEKEFDDQVKYIVRVDPQESKKGGVYQSGIDNSWKKSGYASRNRTTRKRIEHHKDCDLI